MNTLKRLCIKRGGRFGNSTKNLGTRETGNLGKLGTWETLGTREPGNPGTREPGNPGTRERKRNSYQAINLTVKHWKEHPYKREHFCLICG